MHDQKAKALRVAVEIVQMDLRALSPDEMKARLQGGAPSILIAAAGIPSMEMSAYHDLEEWTKVIETNLTGNLKCAQAVLPEMIRAKRGSIVFVGSESGRHGFPGMSAYSASKAGLVGLCKSMAAELGSKGIRVNVVSPGPVESELMNQLDESQQAELIRQTPLGRFARPEEVARAAAFRATSDSSFITGQSLAVNGGLFR